jgi:hypothetical protein
LKKKILLGLTADEHKLVQADQFKVHYSSRVQAHPRKLGAEKSVWHERARNALIRHKIKTMNAIEVVKRYADAWHRHDADAIVALFVEGGTYSNPDAGQGLTGQAIADFAKGLFSTFPDLSLEIVSIGDTGGGLVGLAVAGACYEHWPVSRRQRTAWSSHCAPGRELHSSGGRQDSLRPGLS